VASGPACKSAWDFDDIVAGRVISIRYTDPQNPLSGRLARVEIVEVFRGAAKGEIEVWTGIGGGDCGFNFIAGQSYLIYANRQGGRIATSICSRTRLVAQAAEDLEYLRGLYRQRATVGRLVGRATLLEDAQTPWPGLPFAGARLTAEGGGRTYSTRTAADGRYELALAVGKYALQVEAADPRLSASISPAIEIVDPRICAAEDVIFRPVR
jgi:hypothetical protein